MELSLLVLGPQDVFVICLVAVVLFGASRVPQFMQGLGQGIKEFKKAVKDDEPTTAAPQAPPAEAPSVEKPVEKA